MCQNEKFPLLQNLETYLDLRSYHLVPNRLSLFAKTFIYSLKYTTRNINILFLFFLVRDRFSKKLKKHVSCIDVSVIKNILNRFVENPVSFHTHFNLSKTNILINAGSYTRSFAHYQLKSKYFSFFDRLKTQNILLRFLGNPISH